MKTTLQWRGPLAGVFDEQTQWSACADGEIAEVVSNETETAAQVAGVCDLSALPRVGALGECAKTPDINAAEIGKSGAMVCRLGESEILVLAAPGGGKARAEEFMPKPRLIIPRRDSHCFIGLGGARAREVLARLCAAPLPQFPELSQTRVAEIAAIVVPEPRAASSAFYLLADSGYAEHLWEEVSETAEHLGGGVHGRKQWTALLDK